VSGDPGSGCSYSWLASEVNVTSKQRANRNLVDRIEQYGFRVENGKWVSLEYGF